MTAGDQLLELVVADASAWRQWLQTYHDSSPGVWLVLAKLLSGAQDEHDGGVDGEDVGG